ncbi:MAG: phenylalanine--tRNA ligase subunit beta [Thermoplasmata archaeon]|nr:phenylalanine--tRNA ligase subunit beta [Thermoplasmata archaeon]
MPVIYASKGLLEEYGLSLEEAIDGIVHLGGEVKQEEDKLAFEVGANRWDLFTPEGIIHALLLLHGKKRPSKFGCEQSGIVLRVDASVKPVRPFVVGAVVEGINIDGNYIAELMQIQEKLHETIGRRRRKLAIGIHDLDKVTPPFTYQAVKPESIAFEPLGFSEEMNLSEILERHPKGIEYRWILEGAVRYPVILDENGNVLSFPPVINGNLTEVTEDTRNLFIDMTGMDLRTLKSALNVLTHSMLIRGGKIRAVEIQDGENFYTPDYTWKRKILKKEEIVSLLGQEIPGLSDLLERMGYLVAEKEDTLEVEIPPYRCDVLHPVDIIEDVGIANGYDNITACLPRTLTVGKTEPLTEIEEAARKFFIGMGAQETHAFVLSSEDELFTNLGLNGREMRAVRARNPKSAEYSIARHSLLPGMLKTIYINQRHPLPIRFFEIGLVLEPEEKRKCCFATVHPRANFTEVKSVAESFLVEFEAKYEVKPLETPYFIGGRGAKIEINSKTVGIMGEIHPSTLEKFGINYPVAAFEIQISGLLLCQRDFNC